MANEKYLKILKKGVGVWNEWYAKHPRERVDLSRANLFRANLTAANLTEANLFGTNLTEANLLAANLTEANLRGANLTEANLFGTNLKEANLIEAKLIKANLVGANLFRANLTAANLNEASLHGARLIRANLIEAKLIKANLTEARLVEANLRGANLSGADLDKAVTASTSFGNVDLSVAKGLETIRHQGPSTIGVDTIYLSEGNIPEVFLRGCGFTELQIEQTKLEKPNLSPEEITNIGYKIIELRSDQKPLELYSCFISYSHKDEEFIEVLHTRMREEKLRTWYAPEDIKAGRKIHEQIDQALRLYDKLLIVLSENSMKSEWVKTELYKARQREISENCRMLFPVGLADYEMIRRWECFDADTGKDLAREIREYYIPDFHNWNNEGIFEESFQRLLRDLKAEDSEKSTNGSE